MDLGHYGMQGWNLGQLCLRQTISSLCSLPHLQSLLFGICSLPTLLIGSLLSSLLCGFCSCRICHLRSIWEMISTLQLFQFYLVPEEDCEGSILDPEPVLTHNNSHLHPPVSLLARFSTNEISYFRNKLKECKKNTTHLFEFWSTVLLFPFP